MTKNDLQDPIDTRTPRQIAGAANGRLAAGAKSPEGRARSAANATKHGLTSKKPKCAVALMNESPAAFDDLCQSLAHCFLPGDTHEMNLVYRMAQAEWLRQRAVHMETAALSEAMRQQAHPFHAHTGSQDLAPTNAEALRAWHAFSKLSSANPAFAQLHRYATAHARAYARAERELRDYRTAKAESIHPTPQPVGPSSHLEPNTLPDGTDDNQDRWLPMQTVLEPEEVEEVIVASPDTPPENEVAATEISEKEIDETKVTPPDDRNNEPNNDAPNNDQPHEPAT